MARHYLALVSHYSALIPVIILLLRLRHLPREWRYFAWFLIIGLTNDFLSQYWIRNFHSNMVNSNIYIIIEYFLLLRLFYEWGERRNSSRYLFLAALGIAVWIFDNFIWHRIGDNTSLFRVVASAVLALLSIDRMNREAIYERGSVFTNSRFLVCFMFMVYYVFKSFIESFNLYQLNIGLDFYRRLWVILNCINIVASCMYSYALICLRPKTSLILN